MGPSCRHIARRQSGGGTVGVADERIDDRWRWEQTIGGPDDHDEVDIEAGGAGECAGGDSCTDTALAWWRHFELGEERRAELAAVHRRTDGVEVAEPIEDAFDLLVSGTFGVVEMLEGRAVRSSARSAQRTRSPSPANGGRWPGDPASTATRRRTSPAGRRRPRSWRRVRRPRGAARERRTSPGAASSDRRGQRRRRG